MNNYTIAFFINGVWTEDTAFIRDLFDDNPLDEELDSAAVVDVPSSLAEIPPFTLCRITETYTENGQTITNKRYYLTSSRETSAVTLFVPTA